MPASFKGFWEISLLKMTMTQLKIEHSITTEGKRINNQRQPAASGHRPKKITDQKFKEFGRMTAFLLLVKAAKKSFSKKSPCSLKGKHFLKDQ